MENESNLISISKTTLGEETRKSNANIKEEKLESKPTNIELISHEKLYCRPKKSSKNKAKIIVSKLQKHIKQLPYFMNKIDLKCSSKKRVGVKGNKLNVQRSIFGGEPSFKKVYHCVLKRHSRSSTPTKPMRNFWPPEHHRSRHYKDDYKAEYDNDNDYDYEDDYDQPNSNPGCLLPDDLVGLLVLPKLAMQSIVNTNKKEDGLKIMDSGSKIIPKSEKIVIEENLESMTTTRKELESNMKDEKELESQDRSIGTTEQYSKDKNKGKVFFEIIQKRFKQLQHFIDTNKKIRKRWSKKHVLINFNKLNVQQYKFGAQQSFKQVYYCFLNRASRSSNKPMRCYEPPQHRRQRPRRYNNDDYDYEDDYNYKENYIRSEPEPKSTSSDDILRAMLFLISCIVSCPCLMCCICFTICAHAIAAYLQNNF